MSDARRESGGADERSGQDARVAVVTGASRGLGFQTSREIGRHGLCVVVTARDPARAEEAAGRLRAEGMDARAAACDVASDASVATLARHLADTFGRCDVLVNNAGTIFERGGQGALDVPADVVLRAIDNNAIGAWRLSRALLPGMNERGYGRIVNVSSGMGALADMESGWPAYRISKTALHAVTVQVHHAARGNVKVNAVCPGWVRTDMGGQRATRSVEQGVAGIVWAATLPDDGPSGGLFRDGKPIPW